MAALWLLVLSLPLCLASVTLPAQASIRQEAATLDLAISNVSATDIGYHRAVILWRTNINASSQVFYDTHPHYYTENYAYHTREATSPVSQHSVGLSGLSAGTSYHFRVRSVAGNREVISADYTFHTRAYGGGGNEEESSAQDYLIIDTEGEVTDWPIEPDGRLLEEVKVISASGGLSLRIPQDTFCLNPEGRCLYEMAVTEDIEGSDGCPLPDDHSIVGRVYDIGPSGSTFYEYAELTLAYNEADIPSGVAESDLYLAWCHGGEWVPLPSVADSQQNTVSARVTHLSLFGIMAKRAPPPAEFVISNLNISPPEVEAGGSITITVDVENTSTDEGTCSVSLWIEDALEQTKDVVLAPQTTQTIAFTLIRSEPGIYPVAIAGLTSSFRVKAAAVPAPSPPPESTPPIAVRWTIIGVLISIATFLVVLWLARRRRTR